MEEINDETDFSWVSFYEDVAACLASAFRSSEPEALCEIFSEIFERAALSHCGPAGRVAPKGFAFIDALALLNQKLGDKERVRLFEALKASPLGLGISATVPSSFPGLVQVPLGLTFSGRAFGVFPADVSAWALRPSERNAAADFFLRAHDFSRLRAMPGGERSQKQAEAAFVREFDAVRASGYFPWNITIALHWIAPRFYVPLDRRTAREAPSWCWGTPDGASGFEYQGEEGEAGIVRLSQVLGAARERGIGGRDYLEIRRIMEERAWKAWQQPGLLWIVHTAFEHGKRRPERGGLPALECVSEEAGIAPGTRLWVLSPEGCALWGDEDWKAYFERGEAVIADRAGLGDLARLESRREIEGTLLSGAPFRKTPPRLSKALWGLRCLKPGDIVYAKARFSNAVMGRGVVASPYAYEGSATGEGRHRVGIVWGGLREVPGEGLDPRLTFQEITNWGRAAARLEGEVRQSEGPSAAPRPRAVDSDPRLSFGEAEALRKACGSGRPLLIFGPRQTGRRLLAELAAWLWGCAGSRTAAIRLERDRRGGLRLAEAGCEAGAGLRPAEIRFRSLCRRAARALAGDPERRFCFVLHGAELSTLEAAQALLVEAVSAELRGLCQETGTGPSSQRAPSDPLTRPARPEQLAQAGQAAQAALAGLRFIAIIDSGSPRLIWAPPEQKRPSARIRERFAVLETQPDFGIRLFVKKRDNWLVHWKGADCYRGFVSCLKKLNAKIKADPALGPGFRFGHWLVADALEKAGPGDELSRALLQMIETEIAPRLRIYFGGHMGREFDSGLWLARLRCAASAPEWDQNELESAGGFDSQAGVEPLLRFWLARPGIKDKAWDFAWVPFYEELAARLVGLFRKEPPAAMHGRFAELFKAAGLALPGPEALPPETFCLVDALALLNQKLADEKRVRLFKALKATSWGKGIKSPVPGRFSGIVSLPLGLTLWRPEGMSSQERAQARAQASDALAKAWRFAQAKGERLRSRRALEFIQNYCRWSYEALPWNRTIAFYWIAPRCYVPLDRLTNRGFNRVRLWLTETPPMIETPPVIGMGKPKKTTIKRRRDDFPLPMQYLPMLLEVEKWVASGKIPGIPWLVAGARAEWGEPAADPGAFRCWLFAWRGEDRREPEAWRADFKDGALFWDDEAGLGDLGRCGSRRELAGLIGQAARVSGKAASVRAAYLWNLRRMKPGDRVYARGECRGRCLIGRGVVERAYGYAPAAAPGEPGRHGVKVRWEILGGPGRALLDPWGRGRGHVSLRSKKWRPLSQTKGVWDVSRLWHWVEDFEEDLRACVRLKPQAWSRAEPSAESPEAPGGREAKDPEKFEKGAAPAAGPSGNRGEG